MTGRNGFSVSRVSDSHTRLARRSLTLVYSSSMALRRRADARSISVENSMSPYSTRLSDFFGSLRSSTRLEQKSATKCLNSPCSDSENDCRNALSRARMILAGLASSTSSDLASGPSASSRMSAKRGSSALRIGVQQSSSKRRAPGRRDTLVDPGWIAAPNNERRSELISYKEDRGRPHCARPRDLTRSPHLSFRYQLSLRLHMRSGHVRAGRRPTPSATHPRTLRGALITSQRYRAASG